MNLIDLFLKEGKQYLMDAMPGGALNREVTPQGLLDATALATAPVPVVGDVAGLAADAKRMYDNPEERTPMNIGLSALGLLPFIPGATVFHGTPHLFNKFDSSKIGTGEGAQAFGHGLYLAENPGVAKDYQQKLSSAGSAKNLASQFGGIDEGLAEAQRRVDRYKEMVAKGDGNSERAKSFLRISEKNLQDLQAMKQGLPENTGYLYQVDLPDEQIAKMLDFDAPFSKQPKAVQDAIKKSGLYKEYRENLSNFASPMMTRNKNMRGDNFMQFLEYKFGGPQQAADKLKEFGVPGMRYLDEESRPKGKGTRNIVVFPGMEDMLRIEQINNQPVESLFRSLGR